MLLLLLPEHYRQFCFANQPNKTKLTFTTNDIFSRQLYSATKTNNAGLINQRPTQNKLTATLALKT